MKIIGGVVGQADTTNCISGTSECLMISGAYGRCLNRKLVNLSMSGEIDANKFVHIQIDNFRHTGLVG